MPATPERWCPKRALTAGNPEGDVMFGVDNTFLSRVVDREVFIRTRRRGSTPCRPTLRALTPDGEATPDRLSAMSASTTTSAGTRTTVSNRRRILADLVDERYAGQLVVENPATSSPGMAFLMATIAEYGEEAGGTTGRGSVTTGSRWSTTGRVAYNEEFSRLVRREARKPLVVSYASSPPFEVIYADPPRDDAPTGVIESSCFRQIEYAGVLAGY